MIMVQLCKMISNRYDGMKFDVFVHLLIIKLKWKEWNKVEF